MTLPVRPHPMVGESLAHYAVRTAHLNLQRPTDIGWNPPPGPLRHGETDLGDLALATGLTEGDLRDLTVHRYPSIVIGKSTRWTKRRRWPIEDQHRYCPGCAHRRRQRDWDLALTMCCLDCLHLLRPRTDPTAYEQIPMGDPLLEIQHDITAHLAEAADRRSRRERLSRLHRYVRLANYTATSTGDDQWPVTESPYLGACLATRPPRPGTRWPGWTVTVTPADPVQIGTLVVACWPHTRGLGRQRRFVTEAWQRIRDRDLHLTAYERSSLPPQPTPLCRHPCPSPPSADTPAQPTPGSPDATELRAQNPPLPVPVTDAASHLTAAGFENRHVPWLLLGPAEFLPPLAELGRRHHLARWVTEALAPNRRQAAEQLPAPRELRIRLTGAVTDPPTAAEVTPFIEALLNEPKVDYASRRSGLASLRAPLWPLPGQVPWELARAWIWVDLTRGPLHSSTHPTGGHGIRYLDLLDYHQHLDPEQRLRLRDHSLQHLADLDSIRHLAAADYGPTPQPHDLRRGHAARTADAS